ncbi:alpha,alpha-trehalase TreF [Natronolimnohabitans sp. A-GB9]|uniref:alpha,alpha-trehalase TreF n=1 Tax=Natronolimnohabitans sp. A-GB9 TaxID=3069757 RepID=UPI0027B0313A|nr:alpha,alpha-trehalase TreF [Natronolimnohabitans sp. A-GB9]MDQ2049705.1 alpha,alpha-trehalase TreF [Natronolimnohabitans sp. A-GB9]
MESETTAIADSHLEGELFTAVQRNGVFADSKRFVDCVPLSDPRRIARSFADERDEPGFDLHAFVETHFDVAGETEPHVIDGERSMEAHIDQLWSHLRREQTKQNEYDTLISLPNPHVVPGGRFREVYYWDSYFVAEGLAAAGRFDAVVDMVENVASLVDRYGFVPNGNRTYYRTRSQLPLFCRMVSILVRRNGVDAATPYLPRLEQEYSFWMDGSDDVDRTDPAHRRVVQIGDHVLNRYWDDESAPRKESYREDREIAADVAPTERPELYRHIRAACESGWDFSSRWLADPDDFASIRTTDLVPVDLNAALYDVERKLAKWFAAHDKPTVADEYRAAADRRRRAVDEYCWDPDDGFYFDYCWTASRRTDRWSSAAVAPLYFGLASDEQATAVATTLEERFLERGGLVTTLTRSGEQWDAPNGWAPLQWMAVEGLRRYGIDDLADEIERRWLTLNRRVFDDAGKLVEKYDVIDPDREAGGGEYPLQDGFGWTNAVVVALQRDEDVRLEEPTP